ncbi:colicin-like pore-forming protein [Providencia rettgeri]|uniref:colicin-like pore-forming protein n=1 Tax=Providencia rettgeri TaxID=587 RepID=UPI001EE72A3B|nr:colicin-like pore-forming protein [Providencia rettgeri]MCG5372188.1 colicin-like pore-forming protein [Providencia rettgeri]
MNDSMTVTAEPDNNGYGTGPEGKGDSHGNGVGDILVERDPNSIMSFKMATDDGRIWIVEAHGLAVKDIKQTQPKFEGFIDTNASANKKGGNSTEETPYNKNIPVKKTADLTKLPEDFARHFLSILRDIKKSKFDINNKISFYHHNFNYDLKLNDEGKVIDYKETYAGKTSNSDMVKYRNLGDIKRKEFITKTIEFEFNTPSSEIREFSIDIVDYNYKVKINDFGILTSLNKQKYSNINHFKKQWIAERKKELEKDGIKTDADLDQYLISFTNKFFNNYEKNRNRVKNLEKETLTDAGGIIADSGEKLSKLLGQEYKNISDRIANDVKNFQGKKIRNLNDALKDLDKVLKNPNFKVSKQDSTAIANAVKHIDAKTLSDNFYRLGKAFKVLDIGLKIEKIREKTVEGFNTGNWNPLMLEVEAMILSGYTASLALSITFSVISTIATILSLGALPVALASIAAIILISYMSSLIDADLVDKINKTLIRPAH